MKKIFYMIVFLMLGTLGNLSAQITLFKGTFDEALKKAQQEKKDLFVDFFAEWTVQNDGKRSIHAKRSRRIFQQSFHMRTSRRGYTRKQRHRKKIQRNSVTDYGVYQSGR